MPTHLIGVDLGGTHLRAVRMDEAGAVHTHQKVCTAATAGPEAVIDQIMDESDHVTRNTQPLPALLSAAVWPTPFPFFLPQIEQAIRTRAMPPYRDVPVLPAALGENAGVIGADSLFLHGV